MKKGKSISDWMNSALTKRSAKPPAVSSAPSRKRKAPSSSGREKTRKSDKQIDDSSLVTGCIPGDNELPWATKHQPQTVADLAVHKKKIAEVQQWLEFSLSPHSRHPILLLTGPPGCGKTATLNALSIDLSFSVIEWVNQVNGLKVEAPDRDDLTLYPESQSKQFHNFLTRANRYPSLLLEGGGSGEERVNKKVVLVEEFPNAFLRDPAEFHRLIKSIANSLVYPLIFIASESHHGSSSSKLFTKNLISDLDIHTISFNPIAHTSLVKTLQKISTIECTGRGGKGAHRGAGERKFHMPPREVIESLAESSAGDVRSAVNSLQFACLRDSSDLLARRPAPSKSEKKSVKHLKQRSSSSSKLRKHSSTDLSLAQSLAIGGRDTSLFLFRALGKILYCKRDIEAETPPTLPPSLKHCERLPLLVSPEDVLEHTHMSCDMFTLYLQQNYLDFFDSIEDVTEGVSYLSDADQLSRFWSDSKDTRAVLSDYSGSVACRGLMFTNRSTAAGKWRPLHKPQWNIINRQYRDNCSTARSLFLHLGASPFAHLWTPIELQTEILPFLAVINPPLRNSGQVSFLQTITHFKSTYQRLHVETLGENDTDDFPSETNSIDPTHTTTTNSLSKGSKPYHRNPSQVVGSSSSSVLLEGVSSQGSSSSQPLSQNVQMGAETDVEIEDFEDDLIW